MPASRMPLPAIRKDLHWRIRSPTHYRDCASAQYLGTNFRRIGALAERPITTTAHSNMRELIRASSRPKEKEPGISMNGIGNIQPDAGYYDDAEKFFRLSLSDEIALKSPIRQAINLANLGAIFEGGTMIQRSVLPPIDGTEPHRRF